MTKASDKTINTLDWGRLCILWPLSLVVRLWGATIRIAISDEDRVRLEDTDGATLLLIWHNRLFMASEIYRRFRKPKTLHSLISASRDGAWLSAFLELMGIRGVRGSSSRRNREALRELVACLRAGNDIAITPDGPRGPMYDFKAGPAAIAAKAQVRILLVGGAFSSAWRVRSWDRFYLPRPFSTFSIRTSSVEPGDFLSDSAEMTSRLRDVLLELGGDTDPQSQPSSSAPLRSDCLDKPPLPSAEGPKT